MHAIERAYRKLTKKERTALEYGLASIISVIGRDPAFALGAAKVWQTMEDFSSKKRESKPRIKTGIPKFNKVLNGGIPEGNTVIISGPAGVGKSTFMLAVAGSTATSKRRVSYYAGEQNRNEIAGYVQRLGLADNANLLGRGSDTECDVTEIMQDAVSSGSSLIVIDTLQTMFHPDVKSRAGSNKQCEAVTRSLTEWAKTTGIAVFLICHVNKDGNLAGPTMLEHLVDGTLEFDFVPDKHDGVDMRRRQLKSGAKFRLGPSGRVQIIDMVRDINPSSRRR